MDLLRTMLTLFHLLLKKSIEVVEQILQSIYMDFGLCLIALQLPFSLVINDFFWFGINDKTSSSDNTSRTQVTVKYTANITLNYFRIIHCLCPFWVLLDLSLLRCFVLTFLTIRVIRFLILFWSRSWYLLSLE